MSRRGENLQKSDQRPKAIQSVRGWDRTGDLLITKLRVWRYVLDSLFGAAAAATPADSACLARIESDSESGFLAR
jgi:hypothetical protein